MRAARARASKACSAVVSKAITWVRTVAQSGGALSRHSNWVELLTDEHKSEYVDDDLQHDQWQTPGPVAVPGVNTVP
jgi:hypothetical protein